VTAGRTIRRVSCSTDFYDVESGNPIHPAPKIDNDGHGTAMATLVREVAPEATIIGIRVSIRTR
jgi:hypothetical protein